MNAVSIAKKIKQLKDQRDVLKKTLKRKQDNMKAVQKLRKEKKVVGERLREEHPELAKALKVWMVLEMNAECSIDEENGVGYCGETYVAIRSSKHNNSSAFSHQQDLRRMKDLLPEIFKDKSVLIKSVD